MSIGRPAGPLQIKSKGVIRGYGPLRRSIAARPPSGGPGAAYARPLGRRVVGSDDSYLRERLNLCLALATLARLPRSRSAAPSIGSMAAHLALGQIALMGLLSRFLWAPRAVAPNKLIGASNGQRSRIKSTSLGNRTRFQRGLPQIELLARRLNDVSFP